MRPMRLLPSHVVHVVLLVPSLASESFQQSVTPVSAPSMLLAQHSMLFCDVYACV